MAALFLKIAGRVQGVGFRYSLCREARRLRVTGWVQNCSDGSVEALAVGDDQPLQQLIEWARHGPAGARVDSLHVEPATAAQASDADDPFTQRSSG
ncbi:MAG TPA: acylphosphatase [Burkholderiaceae bacterium]|nr:acylphosphatase [Burkholderiaceae bacterium]